MPSFVGPDDRMLYHVHNHQRRTQVQPTQRGTVIHQGNCTLMTTTSLALAQLGASFKTKSRETENNVR